MLPRQRLFKSNRLLSLGQWTDRRWSASSQRVSSVNTKAHHCWPTAPLLATQRGQDLLSFGLAEGRLLAGTHQSYHSGQICSVQFSCSVMSDSLWPHESQHTRPPCPSLTPGVHSNSCPSSQWCHPAISSSVIPFSCPQSLPASESFPMSQLFAWGSQSTSFLPKNTQGWSPSEWTGWISLQSKGLSIVFSNTTVQNHQFFGAQLSSQICYLTLTLISHFRHMATYLIGSMVSFRPPNYKSIFCIQYLYILRTDLHPNL